MVLDDQGILEFLETLEKESKAIRHEISQMVIVLEGRISWTEAWNLSREDRESIAESFEQHQKAIERAMKKK